MKQKNTGVNLKQIKRSTQSCSLEQRMTLAKISLHCIHLSYQAENKSARFILTIDIHYEYRGSKDIAKKCVLFVKTLKILLLTEG